MFHIRLTAWGVLLMGVLLAGCPDDSEAGATPPALDVTEAEAGQTTPDGETGVDDSETPPDTPDPTDGDQPDAAEHPDGVEPDGDHPDAVEPDGVEPDAAEPPAPLSSVISQTGGGGKTSSAKYILSVTIGHPQPMATRSSADYTLRLGPVAAQQQ